MKPPNYTPEDEAYIIEHHGRKMLTEIAAERGIPYGSVRNCVKKNGLSGQHGGQRYCHNRVDVERVLAMYSDPRWTAQKIADELVCNVSTVMRIASDHCVQSPRVRTIMTNAEANALLARYATMSARAIAEQDGVSLRRVESQIRTAKRRK